MHGIEWYELAEEGELWWVWGVGHYPPGTVLEGAPRRVRMESFESAECARRAYPSLVDKTGSNPAEERSAYRRSHLESDPLEQSDAA